MISFLEKNQGEEIMEKNENGYVSVVGQALIQPIFDLVEKLESKEPVPPNEVQTGQRENGYSLAIIALGAILLESALNRTAYVRQEEEPLTGKLKTSFCCFDSAECLRNDAPEEHGDFTQPRFLGQVFWRVNSKAFLDDFCGRPGVLKPPILCYSPKRIKNTVEEDHSCGWSRD